MDFDQTTSFCGLDATVRLESSNDGKLAIKRRRHDPPLEQIYPLDIQFYTRAPYPVSIEKMKELVKERILALKEIHLIMKNSSHGALNVKREVTISKLETMRLHRYAKFINSPGHRTHSIEELEDRVIDHVSFVALRLALVTNSDERALHQSIEEELFHLRVSALDDEGIYELLAFNEIEYEKISNNERIELKNELAELLDDPINYEFTEFFKVPILTLLGFINVRDVHIREGIAYVPLHQMRVVLNAHYHEYLKSETAAVNIKNLELACKIEDGSKKFNDFFKFCCLEFETLQQKITKQSNISVAMIDALAQTTFPPCMRVIHEYLRKHHHLKHESRLQYTLFLKTIGLRVQDTLTLFREEFTQKVSLERFEKEYAYYIFHAYGMRGRKYDTPAKDCSSIIKSITPFGDCNGCVFVHNGVADMEDLGKKLSRWNISEDYIAGIVKHTKGGQCGHACATYFHAINGHSSSGPIVHPNEFFNDSQRLSNLSKGCISDDSEDSGDEGDYDIISDTNMEADVSISTNFSKKQLTDFINMIIDWEDKICPHNLRGGTMVKLKHK